MSYSNDRSRVLQPDSKLFCDSGSAKTSTKSGQEGGRLRFCLKFAAFVFSHVGLGFVVLIYTVFGAFIFRHFEGLPFSFGLLICLFIEGIKFNLIINSPTMGLIE